LPQFDKRIPNLQLTTRSEHKKLHGDIGKETRFKKIYKLNFKNIYNRYLKIKCMYKMTDEYGCSEATLRRFFVKKTGVNSLREFAQKRGWKYARR